MTHEVRKIVVAWFAAVLVVVFVPRAQAHHLPNDWCSRTGDVCLDAGRQRGERWLSIWLEGRYFGRYRLCVRAPDDTVACKVFKIRDLSAFYGHGLYWHKHFPNQGDGAYTVTWRTLDGTRVGRRLGFHLSKGA